MAWNLRTKISVSVGCLLLLVLSIHTAMTIQVLRQKYLEALEWHSEALVQNIIHEITRMYALFQDEPENLTGFLRGQTLQCIQLYESYKARGVEYCAIFEESGLIAAHSNQQFWDTQIESPLLLEHLPQHKLETILDGNIYHTLIPIVYAEEKYIATVSIGISKTWVDQNIQPLIWRSGIVFAFSLGGSFLILSLLLSFLVTQPIKTLIATGQQIASGEIERPESSATSQPRSAIHLTSSDEIQRLTAVFQTMTRYLQQMAAVADHISRGDLRETVQPRSEDDVLGMAFQRMTEYLTSIATELKMVAAGDLRQIAPPNHEQDILGTALHNMIALRRAITQIKTETDKVGDSAEVLSELSMTMAYDAQRSSRQIQSVSSNSHQLSEHISTVTLALEELNASIREIACNANEVMNVVAEAVAKTHTASEVMHQLGLSSVEIGDIVKVITQITEQSNLLALNATIEAVRAGEAGKGFVVVANEMKQLSRQIASSAEDITRKVATMQTNSQNVADVITQISASIQQVHTTSGFIAAAVEEHTATTQEISDNVNEASQSSETIARTMAEVAAAMQATMEKSFDMEQAAEHLTALTNNVQKLVKTFQV